MTGGQVILTLKVAVAGVSVVFVSSLLALWRGNYRLHGRINLVFFVLTLSALVGLELVVRFLQPHVFDYFDEATRRALAIHLCFSVPAAVVLPFMLWSGRRHRRTLHLAVAGVFAVLWTGTVITGALLPHGRIP